MSRFLSTFEHFFYAFVLMSQPEEKRTRVQQEPGSSPSVLRHTPSEYATEMITASAGNSEGKEMEIAHPSPVQAVVLARPSRDAQTGIVLLSRDAFPRLGDKYPASEISTASALSVVAKARAQDDYPPWTFVGPAIVYDYNPTGVDPQELEPGNDVPLALPRKPLQYNTLLHGRRDPDDETKVVDAFFVLVTAFEKPQGVPMQLTPAFDHGKIVDVWFVLPSSKTDTAPRAADVRNAAHALVNVLLDSKNLQPQELLELDRGIVLKAVNLSLPCDVILFRDAYQLLIEKIEKQMVDVSPQAAFIEITGNRGIGKSTMIIFLLRHLFQQKKKVVHLLERSTVYYIPRESDDGSTNYEVLVVPASKEYDRSADAYVTDLKEPPVIAFPNLYFWTHSPGGKTSSFLHRRVSYTLPVWSYAELKCLNDRLKQQYANDDGTSKFPALSDEALNANFARWGGVPGSVMIRETDSEALLQQGFNKLQRSNSAGIGVLEGALTTYLENERVIDRLFLTAVDEDFQPSARYMSKKIGAFIMQFFQGSNHELQREFMALYGGYFDTRDTYGKLFEPFCHSLFSLGKELQLGLKHLPRPAIKNQDGAVVENAEDLEAPQQLNFPAESVSVVWFNTLEGLAEAGVQPGMYYRPTYETMHSGDAFLLVRHVDDHNVAHYVLFIFQITVSRSHPVIGQGILDIIGLFDHLGNLEVRLVFLVPTTMSEGFRRQSYHKAGEKKVLRWNQQKKRLREVKQYVAGIEYALPLPDTDTDEVIAEDDCTVGVPGDEVIDEDDEGAAAAETKGAT